MEKIFKELPISFPFYETKDDQNRYRENIVGLNQYSLISPKNALLPFQIEMPKNKTNPVKWEIKRCDGNTIDISNNMSLINVYEFLDKRQAVYKGDKLNFTHETINQDLNLPCGEYYTVFTFADNTQYVSEMFTVPKDSFNVGEFGNYVKIEFWNSRDLEPILYRSGFKQVMYIDTFINQFNPEVEEDTEKDGTGADVPTYQKLILKYKFVAVVPDFVKIALVSLQIHDSVYIHISDTRKGYIDRAIVTATPHDEGGMNDVEVVFEDDMLINSACVYNTVEQSVSTW